MIGDRGSVTLTAVSLVAMALALAVGLAGVVTVLHGRSRATTAADAAALGAAPATFPALGLEPPDAIAGQVSAANEARLVSCLCPIDSSWAPRSVVVEVAVDVDLPILGTIPVTAVSRAEFDPVAMAGS